MGLLLADEGPGEADAGALADLPVIVLVEGVEAVPVPGGHRRRLRAEHSRSAARSAADRRTVARRIVSTSMAVRMNRPAAPPRSRSGSPSWRAAAALQEAELDSRQKASRTGWRDTPSAVATSASDMRVPGGSSRVMICR